MNPIPFLAIILAVLAFEGLVFGQDLAASSFPTPSDVDFASCTADGVWNAGFGFGFIGCVFQQVLNVIVNFFKFLYGTAVFFFGLISFNVGGAPLFVRFFLGSIFGGTILWSLAGLFRGGGA